MPNFEDCCIEDLMTDGFSGTVDIGDETDELVEDEEEEDLII